jgi:hypothetical protein
VHFFLSKTLWSIRNDHSLGYLAINRPTRSSPIQMAWSLMAGCIVWGACRYLCYSCLMDFKGHIIGACTTHTWEWICARSTAVKFGIPFGPVLKHGPRSLSNMRVNEYMKLICRKNLTVMGLRVVHSCAAPPSRGISINIRSNVYGKYTMSMLDGTRKMVNYAWSGWSQGKPWWRTEAVLTCKSIVGIGHRGERLIEPSSSW